MMASADNDDDNGNDNDKGDSAPCNDDNENDDVATGCNNEDNGDGR